MRASACGLYSLGEKTDASAVLHNTDHMLDADEVRLIEILGDDSKRYEDAEEPFFQEILITANHIDIAASESVYRVASMHETRAISLACRQENACHNRN